MSIGGQSVSAVPATGIYTGTVGGTKVEVTDNPDCLVFGFNIANLTAAVAYLQVFDLDADNVTVGTTVANYVLAVAAAPGVRDVPFPKPIQHSTGFTIASTTTATGATGANQDVAIVYVSKA